MRPDRTDRLTDEERETLLAEYRALVWNTPNPPPFEAMLLLLGYREPEAGS